MATAENDGIDIPRVDVTRFITLKEVFGVRPGIVMGENKLR